ncbi:MAG: FG-GAP-like repeat-containing protein, partial [Bacteroidetes bacterium]|nr:FG-GAP-like repeat-containing protein [Bacteroidota bacterium]
MSWATRVDAQVIASFSPLSGPVGSMVTITGSGFNTSPANNIVFFGATRATVNSASATSLVVSVPSGASFLYITVTNLSTNLTAYSENPFNVTTSCSSTSSFAPAVTVQGGSHNLETCDIDGDGKPDLVIADYFNNTFTVTRNTSVPGNISFAAKVAFPWAAGGQPNEISIGDIDGDGKPDIALGGNGGGTFISVYRNTSTAGSISFASRVDVPASSGQGNGNKIIDIDKDGKPDIISVHWSGNCIWVLRNTSTGPGIISFAAGVSFATTSQPHKIDVGDLDGDLKPDVVITAFTSNAMSVFRNTSAPGTISFAARQDFAPGTVPYFVHIGDLDGDGKADIAVVNRDVATLAIYRNISNVGSITLAARQTFATPAGTMTHYGVAFGDLDGDGKPDIATGNYTLNITSVFRNTSVPGTISFAARTDLSSGVSYDVTIDDFDGDSRPDLAVTNSGTTVSVLMNVCTLVGLPVELISFSGEPLGKEVLISWSTASEINNEYFTIERSRNGIDFQIVGEVNGAGNSTQTLKYEYLDHQPYPGINYYRLKQTDVDGAFKYSELIVVKLGNDIHFS